MIKQKCRTAVARQSPVEEKILIQRFKPIVAAFITMALVTFVGVAFFFRPIAAADTPSAPWPAPVAVLLYLVLSIGLFDWTARRLRKASTAAVVIGGAQLIVIVDLLARGERGLITALAGTGLLIGTWFSVALVYAILAPDE
jgi:hypothetical protein